jgi:cell division protein FtsQ
MARSQGPLIPDDSPAPRNGSAGPTLEDDLDPRLLDLEKDEEPAFLRGQKRVPVRRGPLPKKAANRLKIALLSMVALGVLLAAGLMVYRYGAHSWRFRLEGSDQIDIAGLHNVTRSQVMEVMGADIGRNVFFVPLDDRKKQLEEIPWVESATVMRFLPNRLKIQVVERTPVAFAQVGSKIALIDLHGVVMDTPPGGLKKYSFPVISGMAEAEPLSTRAARMKIYGDLVRDLDAGGAHYSQDLSEVDLSDPEDVKVTANDPNGEVLIHLGSSNFLDRFKVYVAHVQEWRQQFQKLRSVDLRYDRQVIVNPDEEKPPAARPKLPVKPAVRKK